MPQQASARFSAHSAELQRRDRDVTVRTEVAVAPRDDMEVRLLTLTNHTPERRRSARGELWGSCPERSQDA
jgi:hypothetical protein